MIYELRSYTVNQGKMGALSARFRDKTMQIFEKHGIKNVAYWTNAVGGRNDEFIYLLAHEDMGAFERAWAAFTKDPEWLAAREESERDGVALVAHWENRLLTPTEYSPLQ